MQWNNCHELTFILFNDCVQALAKFLKSVTWTVAQEEKQALELLERWAAIDSQDALELLAPTFSHPAVRKYAVARLQKADDEVCQS